MAKSKYKRISDLYTVGDVIALEGDNLIWMQVLNPYEKHECQLDAQTARARLVLALKDEGSDETARLRGTFEGVSDAEMVDILVEFDAGESMVKAVNGIKDDPEWAERNAILERSDDLIARPESDPERKLLASYNEQYMIELQNRVGEELDYLRSQYAGSTRGQLWESYVEKSIEAQGSERAIEEYYLTEIWLASRNCDATWDPINERYDHENCGGHKERAWDDKHEVRTLPDTLQALLRSKMDELNMSVREAKNLDRQRSSSGSSPLPNAEAASTPSTPAETPDSAPGTSPSPLTTASPS